MLFRSVAHLPSRFRTLGVDVVQAGQVLGALVEEVLLLLGETLARDIPVPLITTQDGGYASQQPVQPLPHGGDGGLRCGNRGLLSSLSLLNAGSIHQINGLKTVLAGLINGVSMVIFIADGSVHWPLAVPMIVSAMAGGWAGATWARKLDKRLVRKMVIGIGMTLTVWYFSQLLTGR